MLLSQKNRKLYIHSIVFNTSVIQKCYRSRGNFSFYIKLRQDSHCIVDSLWWLFFFSFSITTEFEGFFHRYLNRARSHKSHIRRKPISFRGFRGIFRCTGTLVGTGLDYDTKNIIIIIVGGTPTRGDGLSPLII